jgi:hypothetical protein
MADAKPQQLIILFTSGFQSNFDLMPRVFTTIQQIRGQFSDPPHPILLLDIGGVHSADSWICQATENRAPYLILDAMGYAVSRADGLDVGGIIGLQEVVQMKLMDDSIVYPWRWRDIIINVGSKGDVPCVTWATNFPSPPPDEIYTHELDGHLRLHSVDGAIGMIRADLPTLTVLESKRIAFSSTARPDPTIVAAIEFVEREAHQYAQKRGGQG